MKFALRCNRHLPALTVLGDYWLLYLPLFVGSINVKPERHSLFSERYGLRPTIVIAGLRISWVKFR